LGIKEFFEFSKSERIGAFVLLVGVLALIAYRVHVDQQTRSPLDAEVRKIAMDSAAALQEKQVQNEKTKKREEKAWALHSRVDLNYLSAREMYGYGFSKNLVDAIFSYKRTHGMMKHVGVLDSFEMVSKLELDSLRKYADFSKYEKKTSRPKKEKVPRTADTKIPIMDLNTVSAADLKRINGIGEVLSERIIKFRDALGGFYTVDQLKEVYGLEDSLVDANADVLQIQSPHRKIKINSATEEELSRHAYINAKMAKTLAKYINQNTTLTRDKFSRIYALTPNQKKRIEPYLDFDN
jgi:competence ComEA-like helix-hairpin-helix protein